MILNGNLSSFKPKRTQEVQEKLNLYNFMTTPSVEEEEVIRSKSHSMNLVVKTFSPRICFHWPDRFLTTTNMNVIGQNKNMMHHRNEAALELARHYIISF